MVTVSQIPRSPLKGVAVMGWKGRALLSRVSYNHLRMTAQLSLKRFCDPREAQGNESVICLQRSLSLMKGVVSLWG